MQYAKIVVVNTRGEFSHLGVNDGDELMVMVPTLESVSLVTKGKDEMMASSGVDVEYLLNCMRRGRVLLHKVCCNDDVDYMVMHPDMYEVINVYPNDDDDDEIKTLMVTF